MTDPLLARNNPEEELKFKIKILSLINSATTNKELTENLLVLIKAFSDCEAVGIRLRDGDDYPYYVHEGFDKEFILAENSLCEQDDKGQTVRDSLGNPVLECMCGNILRRRVDPSLPFFTNKGSFWSNCTSDLLAGTSEDDRQSRTRNRCNGEGYESVALVPLQCDEKNLGLIQLNDRRKNCFTLERIELFENLAESIAMAIEHRWTQQELATTRKELEQAYERERHISDVLQRALIPEVDRVSSGCEIAANYVPALNEASVGGDFYDVFETRDGILALVMGDVSGKGLAAAGHTAMAKHMLRAFANIDPSPATVLDRLNKAVCSYAPEDLFVTMFYGLLDPETKTLVYADAGHDQPLHYSRKTQSICPLDITGKAIGFIENSEYTTRTLQLESGDVVLVYTDGVTDARVNEDFLGVDGLSEMLSEEAEHDAKTIVERTLLKVTEQSRGKLRDDAAVLVVKAS